MQVFVACGEEGERGRQMLLFSATMPVWVDKVGSQFIFPPFDKIYFFAVVLIFVVAFFFLNSLLYAYLSENAPECQNIVLSFLNTVCVHAPLLCIEPFSTCLLNRVPAQHVRYKNNCFLCEALCVFFCSALF